MTLFETDSQHREKVTIWRALSQLPLYSRLAGGRIFRWFAVNIPMGLEGGDRFTSDIDIIARLREIPPSRKLITKTWEVKVSLLHKDGSAQSLKSGKTDRTLKQLAAYRNFGSPDVSLLDVYVCEAGFMKSNSFPPPVLAQSLETKVMRLREHGFGYDLLPCEHSREGQEDMSVSVIAPLYTPIRVLYAVSSEPGDEFLRLVSRIDKFFDRAPNSFKQVIYCTACRELQLVRMRDEYRCPSCGSNLIARS
jgi:hypothetical protein